MRLSHALTLSLLLGGCAAPSCKNHIARRVPAPDNAHDAVVYHRDCGDGQPNTEVAVIQHDADLPDVPTSVLTLAQDVDVAAAWSGASRLAIAYPRSARLVGKQERSQDGVAVTVEAR